MAVVEATTDEPIVKLASAAPSTAKSTTSDATPLMAAAAPTAAPPVTVKSIITDLLTWIGLGPLASGLPVPPLPVPPVVESLWLAVRQHQYTWNNQRPTARPTISGQDPNTGFITGKVNATDYDDNALTYTVSSNPMHGTVVVDALGNFTYTPGTAIATTGGADTFIITIDDTIGNPPHVHGLLGLLGWDPPAKAKVMVSVTPVQPGNTAPKVGTPAYTYTVEPLSGAVTGRVNVTDPDGDHLTYSLVSSIDPMIGSVTVDTATGAWTYTSSGQARLDAWNSPGQDAVSFSIVVSDGQHNIQIAVSSPIAPAADFVTSAIHAGDSPSAVAVGSDGRIYVTNSGSGTVSTINPDGTTGTTITVGSAPYGLAVAADGRVYVTNSGDNTVTVINPDGSIDASAIRVGDRPAGVAEGADGRIYVANFNDGTVTVIHPDDYSTETIDNAGASPYGVAVSKDGLVYVTCYSDDAVAVINPDDYSIDVIDDVVAPTSVAVGPDGRVYVVNLGHDTVTVLVPSGSTPSSSSASLRAEMIAATTDRNTTPAAVVPMTYTSSTIPVANPSGVAVGDNGAVYITNASTNTVTVIYPDGSFVGTIAVGVNPGAVAVHNHSVWVVNQSDGTVTLITSVPPTPVREVGTIDFGRYALPNPLAVSADGSLIYTVNYHFLGSIYQTLEVIDRQTNTVVNEINLDDIDPQFLVEWMKVSADGNKLFIRPQKWHPDMSQLPDLVVLDAHTGNVLAQGSFLDPTQFMNDPVLSPDGSQLYMIRNYELMAYNTTTYTFQTLSGPRAMDLAIGSDGRLYAYNQDDGAVYVYNTSTNRLVTNPIPVTSTTVEPTPGPVRLAVSPDGTRLYAASGWADIVSIIDTANYQVLAELAITEDPSVSFETNFASVQMAISPDGKRLYLTSVPATQGNTPRIVVSVVDTALKRVTAEVPVDGPIDQMFVSADGAQLFLHDYLDKKIKVLDVDANAVIDTIEFDSGLAVMTPDGSRIYVGRYDLATNTGSVAVINTAALNRADDSNYVVGYAPQSTWGLFDRLHEHTATQEDGTQVDYFIEKILGEDNETRLIVYAGGTVPFDFAGQPVVENIPAYFGEADPDLVDLINTAVEDSPAGIEIMLVGFSQGGMEVQNVAYSLDYNVTTVVSFAAPIVRPPLEDEYKAVHIQANGDLVPAIPGPGALFPGHKIFAGDAPTGGLPLEFHGNPATYQFVGALFDKNATDYTEVQENMLKFRGEVIEAYR